MKKLLDGYKTYLAGAALALLGLLVLFGISALTVKVILGLGLIAGAAGLVALRLAVKKAETKIVFEKSEQNLIDSRPVDPNSM